VRTVRVAIEAQRTDDGGRADPRQPQPRHITMWLSDDALRVPYRIEGDTDLGRARVELTGYVPGEVAPALARP
jgi:hypothetical protein